MRGSDLSLWLASPPPCITLSSVKKGILPLLPVQDTVGLVPHFPQGTAQLQWG